MTRENYIVFYRVKITVYQEIVINNFDYFSFADDSSSLGKPAETTQYDQPDYVTYHKGKVKLWAE